MRRGQRSSGRFTREDIDAVVLRPSDAPAGTAYVAGSAAPSRPADPDGRSDDVAFAFTGTTADGSRVAMYLWRVDNLILA